MKKGLFVISGCPRSGTSLMMDIHRVVFGDDRILGKKFPQEEQIEMIERQGDEESDEHYSARMYVYHKRNDKEKILMDLEESKDMNPNGFWEMLYTVQGIQYRLHDVDQLNRILTEEKPLVCKIVSQGLSSSDPRFIRKMVYMVRHPRSVAKSQERLKRQFPMDQAPILENGEEVKVHTPEMYIHVTHTAAQWFLTNPEIPVHFVNFDELLTDPKTELKSIQEFYGEGDFTKAYDIIEPKLKRSLPEDVESPFWEDAEAIYEMFVKKDFEGIVKYMEDPSRAIYVYNAKVFCTRCNTIKVYNQCKLCRTHETTRENFKKSAEKVGVDWAKEPCIFECLGLDRESNALTLEESIKHNFWKEGVSIYHPDKVIQKEEEMEDIQDVKDVVFNQGHFRIILDNLEIFKFEYPEIPEKDWDEWKNKKCPSCRKKVMMVIREDMSKLSDIISKITGETLRIHFPEEIESPIIKEFSSVVEMENYLKELKQTGKQFKSATPTPDGNGGFLLTIL